MHGIMGADHDGGDIVRDRNAGKVAGKRLFIDMGMVKGARPQQGPVGVQHLPPVRVVVPALVGMVAGGAGPARDFDEAKRTDEAAYGRFFHAMLERGVYLAPSAFEAGFVSAAHSDDDIAATIEAARDAIRDLCGRAAKIWGIAPEAVVAVTVGNLIALARGYDEDLSPLD